MAVLHSQFPLISSDFFPCQPAQPSSRRLGFLSVIVSRALACNTLWRSIIDRCWPRHYLFWFIDVIASGVHVESHDRSITQWRGRLVIWLAARFFLFFTFVLPKKKKSPATTDTKSSGRTACNIKDFPTVCRARLPFPAVVLSTAFHTFFFFFSPTSLRRFTQSCGQNDIQPAVTE